MAFGWKRESDRSKFLCSNCYRSISNDPCGRIGNGNGVQASGIRSVRNAGNWRVIPTFLRDWKDRESDNRWKYSFADYKYGKNTETGEDGVKLVINTSGNI